MEDYYDFYIDCMKSKYYFKCNSHFSNILFVSYTFSLGNNLDNI